MMLGGKDHYEADREFYRRTMEIEPNAPLLAQAMRRWLIRVVRYLTTTAKIDQFLDCGSGLPTAENTHQVAQRINPEATVVYVDNDPMVIAHARALLEENDHTHVASEGTTRPPDGHTGNVVALAPQADRRAVARADTVGSSADCRRTGRADRASSEGESDLGRGSYAG
jgi:hypothetical protein